MIKIHNRPDLSAADTLTVVQEHFGLSGTLTPLAGERDLNFRLDAPGGEQYVVKVSSPDEPDEILEIEVDLMRHVARTTEGLSPSPIPAKNGDYIVKRSDELGDTRIRVSEYLSGGLLASVRPRTDALLYDLGSRVAQLVSATGSYPDHPPARIDFDWALGRSGLVMERCLGLFQGEELNLIQSVFDEWNARESEFLGLGSQVIHGDINDHNVLVSASGDGVRRITGIIDLGDAHSAPRVFDLGVALAYAVMDTEDPLFAAAHVVRGFHERTPLSEDEVDVAYTLMRARLGASVSISRWRQQEAGATDPYLSVSERPAWDVLRKLADIPVAFADGVMRDACGFPACRRSAALEQWLSTQAFKPVMKLPEDAAQLCTLDLSVASPLLTGRDTEDTDAFTSRVFRSMEDQGCTVGIGRYMEPRAFYLTEIFAGRPGDDRERRTVHLGVDIFDQAGADVFAPLGGTIHSVHDNGEGLDYGPTVILEHAGPAGPFWTLYGHLERVSVAELQEGAQVTAGDGIGRIGPYPENGDWPPHLHFQIITDMLGNERQFPGVALPRERSVWGSFCPDPNLMLGIAGSVTWEAPAPLQERRTAALGTNLSLSYDEPLHIVRGAGSWLYDLHGRGYLDCVNNVAHVGHEHPAVIAAGRAQMGVLNTNTRYLHENVVRYAERLAEMLPDPLSVCFFVNSGSEANELALRMARAHTGGSGVVCIEGGYHGNTQSLVDVSHYKHAGAGGAGAPEWSRAVPMPDDYRGLFRRDVMDRADRYAASVATAFQELGAAEHQPAAFIAEAILSCGGQIEPPQGYLPAAVRHAREAGAVYIADEVQIGFGRVGSHRWGFESAGVQPDIVALGKPIGNGHPIGAVVTTREIADSFANGMEFFSTFGGNPVSAAIGLAVLDALDEGRLQEHAAVVGGTLKGSLASLAMEHECIGDVRGRGLFLGIEFVSDRRDRTPAPGIAKYVANRAQQLGVLLSTDGPDHNVIKIKPPMTFNESNAERMVSTLGRILLEDGARHRSD